MGFFTGGKKKQVVGGLMEGPTQNAPTFSIHTNPPSITATQPTFKRISRGFPVRQQLTLNGYNPQNPQKKTSAFEKVQTPNTLQLPVSLTLPDQQSSNPTPTISP